ncbi:MAG: glycerophosphodiester phosphodiesterase family protein [Legionellaceae bacterium]|nr:glycerophosphodiester phosphodiesterase family protein [Legionellaceae bacterium]
MQHCFITFFRHLLCAGLCLVALPAESVTVYGHRGARGLAPENTLPGFHVAIAHRVDYVDVDVVLTKDNVLVAHHGLTLDPEIARDVRGNWVEAADIAVKNLTFKALQQYDVGRIKPLTDYAAIYAVQKPLDGTRIPSLQAVIREMKAAAPYPVGFQIELKTDPTKPHLSASPEAMAHAVDAVIRAEGVSDRTKVQAYDWRCLQLLQQLNPTVETAYLTDVAHEKTLRHSAPAIAGQWTGGYLLKDYHNSVPEMIKALGGAWWDAEDAEMTQAYLDSAHALGLKVATWSDANRTGMDIDVPLTKEMLNMQVEGIITDRPDVVMALIHEKSPK